MKRFAMLAFLMAGVAAGQERSAADLIKFLGTPRPPEDEDFLITCGQSDARLEANRKDREAAGALVRLGPAAVHDLEKMMDSFGPSNAWLLLHAYASIRGTEAFPRLRTMLGRPEGLQTIVEDSTALSLSLTGYVSSWGILATRKWCRDPTPRDAMNQFVHAWEENEQTWLQRSLGPVAKGALAALQRRRSWDEMRADLWPSKLWRDLAVGYRFGVTGPLSGPEETLDETSSGELRSGDLPLNPAFDTEFKTASGADCGRHRVQFIGGPHSEYRIDNSDLGDLLRLIAACAAAR
jgi:hypothetical protein